MKLLIPTINAAMAEEFTFEDVQASGTDGSKEPATPIPSKFERVTSLSSYVRSDKSVYSQGPDSPGGSVGSSSNISRTSDAGRSTKSLMSLRSQKERSVP